jgi:[ribosomal protein S5]-alanine N-acetyltransferase
VHKPFEILSERLLIRPWRIDDVKPYMQIAEDLGYHQFSPPGLFYVRDESEALTRLQTAVELFQKDGIGKFAVFQRETGEIVGTCGLDPWMIHGKPEVELSNRYRMKFWYQGFALEASRKVLEYGFNVLKYPQIYGCFVAQNLGSKGIVDKLGFTFDCQLEHAGALHELYRLERP